VTISLVCSTRVSLRTPLRRGEGKAKTPSTHAVLLFVFVEKKGSLVQSGERREERLSVVKSCNALLLKLCELADKAVDHVCGELQTVEWVQPCMIGIISKDSAL
jgi:hypothetical protein